MEFESKSSHFKFRGHNADGCDLIKRVDRRGSNVLIMSDNTAFPPYELPAKGLRVIGRVVWYARQLHHQE